MSFKTNRQTFPELRERDISGVVSGATPFTRGAGGKVDNRE